MAISDFIPEVWAAQFDIAFEAEAVFPGVCNRMYEGEIMAAGDTVKIPMSTLTPTIRDYVRQADIAAPQRQDGSTVDLVIDKEKYWNVAVDDVNATQSRPDLMTETMRLSAREMSYQVDDDVEVALAAVAANRRGFNIARNESANIRDGHVPDLLKAQLAADKANWPMEGRWAIVPPVVRSRLAFYLLEKGGTDSAPRAAPTMVGVTSSALTGGSMAIGRVAGWDLRVSNRITVTNVDVGGTPTPTQPVYFGTGQTCTFADQLVEVEAYRPEKQFADAVKGLRVYGIKIPRDERLGVLTIRGADI